MKDKRSTIDLAGGYITLTSMVNDVIMSITLNSGKKVTIVITEDEARRLAHRLVEP